MKVSMAMKYLLFEQIFLKLVQEDGVAEKPVD
jgi:hypothetical protein